MASDTRVVPQLNDVTIDADWRIAAQAIEAALLAVGLTKMSGPTQMDLATVAAPATNAQATGYHYWQFTDPKQASRPICFRTSYGRWTAATRFSLKILVAGGFTAAGATVGWSMTEEQIGPITGAQAGSPTVTLRTCFTPYGLWLALHNSASLTASSYGLWLMRSWGGSDFGDLAHFFCWNGNSSIQATVADLAKLIAGGRTGTQSESGSPGSLNAGMPLVGSDASIFPLMCSAGRVEPVPGICFTRTSEVGAGTFQVDMLGATRNYLQSAAFWYAGMTGTAPVVGLIWE